MGIYGGYCYNRLRHAPTYLKISNTQMTLVSLFFYL